MVPDHGLSARSQKSTPAPASLGRLVPVAFVVCNILVLYNIYTWLHIVPMINHENTRSRGMAEGCVFNILVGLMTICYARCLLTSPGGIPDREQDPAWEYVGQDGRPSQMREGLIETKRDGQRRHCKWCAKYKPDRTHHCRVCRTCVLKMDHHCPWIYNCVGMKNYKHFFLLLLYTVLDTQLILWTMAESVKRCIDEPSTPFVTMFTTFFGWTLNLFLTVLLTAFFGFHIWLMLKAMTTIEFCEKSGAKDSNRRYASSVYDLGLSGNVRAVLGDNVLLWLLPCGGKQGDGLHFVSDESRLSRDIATGKGIRRKGHQTAQRAQRQDEGGGSHYFYGGGSPYGSPQAPH